MSTSESQSADELAVEIPPEHVVSAPLRRALQQCYDRGKALLAKDTPDHDYANTMFTECVVKDPSNLVYVDAFLDNLQNKYKNNKRGARSLGFGGGKKSEFKKALHAKNWVQLLKVGPELLKTNPWDVATLRAMAQACEIYRYNEVELRYLKNALDANPKDVEVNRHCAQSLARMGQFDQAIACWHRIEELKPNDPDAAKMVGELTVEKTRMRAMGVTMVPRRSAASGSTSAAPAAKANAAAAANTAPTAAESTGHSAADESPAPQRREIQLTPVQRLERAISLEPTLVENYLELAEIYISEQKFADAHRVIQRGQQAAPGALDLVEKAAQLEIRQCKHQLRIAEKRAAKEDTPAARELVDQLKQNLLRIELQAAHAQADRYPEDLQAKFTLAMALKRLGNYRQAADQFQAAREHPDQQVVATLELGECLQHLKQYVKALHCYQRAAEKADRAASDREDSADWQKLALYRAGVLAMGLKDWPVATSTLEQLVQLDAGYRDAAARLDKVRSMSDKG